MLCRVTHGVGELRVGVETHPDPSHRSVAHCEREFALLHASRAQGRGRGKSSARGEGIQGAAMWHPPIVA